MDLCLSAPEMNAVFYMGFMRAQQRGDNHLRHPAGHVSFDVAQDNIGSVRLQPRKPVKQM